MKNKSVIVEWIICYIVILMIPIITIFVNYFYSINVIKKELYKSNEMVLDNLADNVDTILKTEIKYYEHMLTYDEFKLLLNRREKDNWFYYYVVVRQIKRCSNRQINLG